MRHRYLLFCLLLSGFAGLAYELLWVRLLALSFGTTTLSFSTVLAVFFGGLALGAYVAGRNLHRVKRPVRAYALIELGTGIAALLLHPVLTHLGDFFAAVDPGPGIAGALMRLVVATPLLLIPTVLMGATLPLVTRAMIRDDAQIARGTALIYGFNTLGAFLGTYLVTFHLLYNLGLWGTTLLTIGINIVVGTIAWILGGNDTVVPQTTTQSEAPISAADQKLQIVSSALTFLGGFAAIGLQVVWVRQFSVFLEGTAYATGSVLIAVLIGIALGSLGVARLLASSRHAALWFAALQTLAILSVLALVAAFPWLQYALSGLTSLRSLGSLHYQLFITTLALLVPTLCSGASLPLLVHLVERRAESAGRTLGSLYASNTVGSILGSLITGFYLLPSAGSEATTWIALLAMAMVGAMAALFLANQVRFVFRSVWIVLPLLAASAYNGFDAQALAVASGVRAPFRAHQEATQREKNAIRYFAEGESATVVVRQRQQNTSLALNGLGQGGLNQHPPKHIFESVLVGFVPLAHLPQVDRGLVVGLGAGVTVDILNQLGVGELTVVELEPQVANAVNVIFGDQNPLKRPNVHLVLDDARHYLEVQQNRLAAPYDLITSMPAHPWVASSIFTREFFSLAKSRLSERGVFSTWFGLGKMDRAASESVVRAFLEVFPHAALYYVQAASAYYMVGSKQPLQLDLRRIEALLAHPILREHEQLTNVSLPAQLYASHQPQDQVPPGITNTDNSAFVELHAPRSSTSSPILRDFLVHETIRPELFAANTRAEALYALLEQLFGTPTNAPLPVRLAPPSPSAKRAFDAVSSALDSEARTYFEARTATTPEALRTALNTVAPTSPHARRARWLAALSWPKGSNERKEALLALADDPETLPLLLEEDPELALSRAPVSAPAEPLAWLIWAAAQTTPPSADDPNFTLLGPVLARHNRAEALQLCTRLASQVGLHAYAQLCKNWHHDAQARIAEERLREARMAGSRGDFKTAAALLDKVVKATPGNPAALELLVRALVETNGDAELQSLRKQMRFTGYSDARIDSWIAEARLGRSIEAPEPEPSMTRPQ